jgi:cytochrome b6-f complex iron-sulfur subunit
MNRKEFIRLMGTGALAVVALNQLGCSKYDSIPRVDLYIDILDPQYYALFTVGGYIYIDSVIVFKGIDFNYYALSRYCTHEGCDVNYQAAFNEIVCPCHGSQYDIYGNVILGPALAPLYVYATSINGTLLHVYTP